jgi:DNA-binding winged helix-turn-helix (wHTH) protein
VERTSTSATRIDAAAAESGGVGTNSKLGALALALADQEVRQQLQLLIQAYDRLAAGGGTAVVGGAAFAGGRVFSFGPFRLLPSQRLLLEDDRRVHVGSRAFDILTTLVERAGEVVGKDELIARVWPNVFIDDSNLKNQVSLLRRASGGSIGGRCYIVTVHGRGYNFVAPVSPAGWPAPEMPGSKQASIFEDILDNMIQRHASDSVLPLPALIGVLAPCA